MPFLRYSAVSTIAVVFATTVIQYYTTTYTIATNCYSATVFILQLFTVTSIATITATLQLISAATTTILVNTAIIATSVVP